jgi:exonuclease III
VSIDLLTWNVAGRVTLQPQQAAAVGRLAPDIVALQEIRPSTVGAWRGALADAGLQHAVDSSEFRDGRRLFNLTASRWPLADMPPIGAPQPERVLGSICATPTGEIEVHNAHIPPAPSNGLVKVETCEALYFALARSGTRERILCGDLNTPRYETDAGEVETFASNHPADEERWDAAERSLLVDLEEWDLRDVFRSLNGWERRDVSWVMHTRSRRRAGHRLDHILASALLNAIWCDYHHEWREAGLSDHSAMAARFEP